MTQQIRSTRFGEVTVFTISRKISATCMKMSVNIARSSPPGQIEIGIVTRMTRPRREHAERLRASRGSATRCARVHATPSRSGRRWRRYPKMCIAPSAAIWSCGRKNSRIEKISRPPQPQSHVSRCVKRNGFGSCARRPRPSRARAPSRARHDRRSGARRRGRPRPTDRSRRCLIATLFRPRAAIDQAGDGRVVHHHEGQGHPRGPSSSFTDHLAPSSRRCRSRGDRARAP